MLRASTSIVADTVALSNRVSCVSRLLVELRSGLLVCSWSPHVSVSYADSFCSIDGAEVAFKLLARLLLLSLRLHLGLLMSSHLVCPAHYRWTNASGNFLARHLRASCTRPIIFLFHPFLIFIVLGTDALFVWLSSRLYYLRYALLFSQLSLP